MERIRADIKKNCIIGEIANKHEVTIKIPEQAKIKQKEIKVIIFYVMFTHNKSITLRIIYLPIVPSRVVTGRYRTSRWFYELIQ